MAATSGGKKLQQGQAEKAELLHVAIRKKRVSEVTQILKDGCDPNSEVDYTSALGAAVETESLEITSLLLDAGCKVNVRNFGPRRGQTALYIAANMGNVELVKLLVAAKSDLNMQWINGNTPLHVATWRGFLDIVRVLIQAGSNISALNNCGETGLHMAALKGHLEIAKEFLSSGCEVNAGKGDSIKLRGFSKTGVTALHLAAHAGNADIAELLLDNGAQIDARTLNARTALHIASIHGSLDVVKVLLARGCEIDARSMENNERKTALMKAAESCHIDIMDCLIEAGADFDLCDKFGCTALLSSVCTAKLRVASALIKAGCDVNIPSKNGRTPFYLSLRNPPHLTRILCLACCKVSEAEVDSSKSDHQMEIHNHLETLLWVLSQIESPQSLLLLVRRTIRSCIGLRPQQKIGSLPIPLKMMEFLCYSEFEGVIREYVKT